MRAIWSMAIKDLKLLSRDKMGLFFILGFPLLIGLFFGSVMGGPSAGSKQNKLQLAVVDEDDSEMSQKFRQRLEGIESVELRALPRTEALEEVRKGRLVGLIALPAGFGASAGIPWKPAPAIEIGMDPSRTAEAAMAEGFVMQSMGQLYGDRLFNVTTMRPFVDELRSSLTAEATNVPDPLRPAYLELTDALEQLYGSIDRIDQESENEAESAVDDETATRSPSLQFADIQRIDVTRQLEKGSRAELFSRVRSKWDITFPQATVWGILGCVAGFSVSIVRERVRGTLQRLEIAPITKTQILMGKGLACFLAVAFVVTMMTAIGYGLGMRPRHFGLLALSTMLIAFCFVGITLAVAVIGKTEEAVGGTGWCVNMVMAMLGGGMIPLLFLPAFMRRSAA